jgi:hypothetical protein
MSVEKIASPENLDVPNVISGLAVSVIKKYSPVPRIKPYTGVALPVLIDITEPIQAPSSSNCIVEAARPTPQAVKLAITRQATDKNVNLILAGPSILCKCTTKF